MEINKIVARGADAELRRGARIAGCLLNIPEEFLNLFRKKWAERKVREAYCETRYEFSGRCSARRRRHRRNGGGGGGLVL